MGNIEWSQTSMLANGRNRPISECIFPSNQSKLFKTIRIYFNSNSYQLDYSAKHTIYSLSHYLKYEISNENWMLLIQGHCSTPGSEEDNLKLGKKRVLAAKKALMKNDIPSSKILAVSYGERKPIAHGENLIAHAQNRRVELMITGLIERGQGFFTEKDTHKNKRILVIKRFRTDIDNKPKSRAS